MHSLFRVALLAVDGDIIPLNGENVKNKMKKDENFLMCYS